jgi:hypothetical protein
MPSAEYGVLSIASLPDAWRTPNVRFCPAAGPSSLIAAEADVQVLSGYV